MNSLLNSTKLPILLSQCCRSQRKDSLLKSLLERLVKLLVLTLRIWISPWFKGNDHLLLFQKHEKTGASYVYL